LWYRKEERKEGRRDEVEEKEEGHIIDEDKSLVLQ